jgi:predicted amino acid-binding ACT domain protein
MPPDQLPEEAAMAIKASRHDIWMAIIDDRAGGAAAKLEALAGAGASLEVVLARRTPEHPGQGVLFASPIEGKKVIAAAEQAGFSRADKIHSVRIEGTDKPGLGAKIARTLAEAGISFRGINGMAMGKNFLSFVALDSADDAAKAVKALRKL